jgi:lysophospholipase L1-like esterase
MKSIYIWIILFCISSSCAKSTDTPNNDTTVATGSFASYLALGDSYTIGQSVAAGDRFPAQTVALLRQQGKKLNDPIYIAQTGWTTANLLNPIASQNLQPNYDVVSLLIGVNDQYQGVDTATYASRFTQLLEKSIQLAKGMKDHVFVLSIPDYSVTPFVPASSKAQVRKEVDMFNAINKRITAAYGVSYTDITPSSREAETNPSLIAGDGLHPSGLEYKKWAAMLAPKISNVLN